MLLVTEKSISEIGKILTYDPSNFSKNLSIRLRQFRKENNK